MTYDSRLIEGESVTCPSSLLEAHALPTARSKQKSKRICVGIWIVLEHIQYRVFCILQITQLSGERRGFEAPMNNL